MVDFGVMFDMDNNGIPPNRRVTLGIRWSVSGTKGTPFNGGDNFGLLCCHNVLDSSLNDEVGGRNRDAIVFSNPVIYPYPLVGIKQYQLWATSENVAGANVPSSEVVTVRAIVYYTTQKVNRAKLELLRTRMNRR
jgi:hypothetical protein